LLERWDWWSPKKIELFCFRLGIFVWWVDGGLLMPGDGFPGEGFLEDRWSLLPILMSLIAFDISLVRLFSSFGLLFDLLELCSRV
jgi:hypothetical protein